ncbi:MAG: hypothetical protein J0I47_08865 [Sphingomonas sp.]|uniref:hypothetical protein n=1 Tax=Sphingomonas sp. TaxID=28214 RepID=UPI001ACF1368|nr:hypothetical protein [Sphingomonas sp.]MBN8808329.1 hypothetical protein [Sphingomonas sp.]
MKTPLLSATTVALLALTACQSKTATTVDNATTTNTTTTETKKPIVLPPSIKSEATYRCHGDNSLVHVTFYSDDKSASVQSPPGSQPVALAADAAGKPLTATGGWSLTGDAKTIKLTRPGKDAMSCDK